MTDLSWENKVIIDFICYDWNFVHLGHSQDLLEVGRREYTATRIGWRVDNDGGSVLVNERLHVEEIYFPVVVGQQVVLPGFNTCFQKMNI